MLEAKRKFKRERKQQYRKSKKKDVAQLLFLSPEQAVCHPLGMRSNVS